ncbi:MAG: relaxase/mobilization nuclease domain-containing protein [Nitrospira sp.]|nr:relaxase/mobilization nuclease domain-containing protein [Nitrospira sp.]
MIMKILSTASLANTIAYVSRVGATLIAGDLVGGSPKERARVMRAQCLAGRPALKYEGIHLVLALAPGQRLTPTQWERAARQALKQMGMGDCLFEAWQHNDKDHEHLHIIASARTATGRRVDRRGDRIRAKRICRQLEREFGFPQVDGDAKHSRRKRPVAPDPGVIGEMRRKVARFANPQGCDKCYSFAQYAIALQREGVQVVPKIRGGRVIGLGYRMEGTYIRAGDLHQSFTFTALRRSGLDWNPIRDLPHLKPSKGATHEAVLAPPTSDPQPFRSYDTFRRAERILVGIGITPARARRIARSAAGANGGSGEDPTHKPSRRGPGTDSHSRKAPGRTR